MKHRPELDGLRGIAILAVLASHAQVPGVSLVGGLAGVTLFFALSGYLITGLLLAEWDARQQIDLRRFYLRRGLRLFPALAVVVVAVVIGSALGIWVAVGGDVDVRFAIPVVILYLSDFVVAGGRLGVLGHTWSLAVEEQFYLLWPFILILALRAADRRSIAAAAILVAVLVTPWRAVLVMTGDLAHAWWWPDTHADALLLGCAVALLAVRLPSWAGWLGLAGIVLTLVAWQPDGAIAWFAPIATIASVLAVAGCPAALRWSPLAYIGRISYGIYLWHYLLIWWGLPWPVVVGISVLVASLSYALIERPFLRLKDRLRPLPGAPVEAATAT